MRLRDYATRAALGPWSLPIGNSGTMNFSDPRYSSRAAKFRDDGVSWLHNLECSEYRYIVKKYVAIIATDGM